MRRKLFSMLLTACLIFTMFPVVGGVAAAEPETTHVHCVCGSAATCYEDGGHEEQEWTKWESTDSLPNQAGYYYLANDVSINSTWHPANGTYLCLNGHVIKMSSCYIHVDGGKTFTLTDCDSTAVHYFKYSKTSSWSLYDEITESQKEEADTVENIDSNTKYVKVLGGCITGGYNNQHPCGGGILMHDSATLKMYGGNVVGNNNYYRGGGVGLYGSNGRAFLYGGSIVGNLTSGYVNGVYNTNYCGGGFISYNDFNHITLGGDIRISHNVSGENTAVRKTDNCRFDTSADKVKVEDDFCGTIGVATNSKPTAGNPVKIVSNAKEWNLANFTYDNESDLLSHLIYVPGSDGKSGYIALSKFDINTFAADTAEIALAKDTMTEAQAKAILEDDGNYKDGIVVYSVSDGNYSYMIYSDSWTKANETKTFNELKTYVGSNKIYIIGTADKHSWSYSQGENGDTIVATCGNATCREENGENIIKISADGGTYDQTPKSATITGSIDGIENPYIVYYTDEACTIKTTTEGSGAESKGSAPVNAGTYYAKASLGGTYMKTSFTIEPAKLTVSNTTVSSKTYDGNTEAQVTVGTLNGVLTDDVVSVSEASGVFNSKDAGRHKDVTVTYTLTGDDAGNYIVEDTKHKASIARRSITLTSGSAEKKYDSEALTNETVTVGSDGWVSGEGATYSCTGSQTGAGISNNTFTYTLNEGTDANNYNIEIVEGTLKVIAVLYDKSGTEIENLPEEIKDSIENKMEEATKNINQKMIRNSAFNGNGSQSAGSSSVKEILGSEGYVEVLLKGLDLDTAAEDISENSNIVTYTFEVTPYDSEGNEQHNLDKAITFRLPLYNPEGYAFADVYHGEKFLKQVVLNGKDSFIEVSEKDFSEFSYTLTNTKRYNTWKFTGSNYAVRISESEHGSVSADNKTSSSGDLVTVTVKADDGYTLETITATDSDGKEIVLVPISYGEKYTFIMPESEVTISATFMDDNSKLDGFLDVEAGDYFYDAVYWAVDKGITTGIDSLHFSPDSSCTRAQMVTFLWRAAGSPDLTVIENPFVDINSSDYYYTAVLWAFHKGIVKGTSAETFSPDDVVKRCQAVTFLARMNGVEDNAEGYTHSFQDVEKTEYYSNAVAWAASKGITDGISSTQFSPDGDCLRCQIVTFLYRCFK